MLTIRTSLADADAINSISRDTPHASRTGSPGGKAIQVEFIDHGPGLSDQDRERVFLPFYTRKAKGMGLGLSIVKGIVEAHRGAICEIGNSGAAAGSGKSPSDNISEGAHFLILLPVLPHAAGAI
jgi:signal transduction histidine kinase